MHYEPAFNILDAVSTALEIRRRTPETALYLADMALAEAEVELYRLRYDLAEEHARAARSAIGRDTEAREAADDADALNLARRQNRKLYDSHHGVYTSVYELAIGKAEEDIAIARRTREAIENELPELAPEAIVTH